MEKIYKDTQAVKIITASARGERLDSNLIDNTNKLIQDLAADPNPMNKYRIGQLIGFAVNEIVQPQTNWMDNLADVKRVAANEHVEFRTRIEGIKAYVQAKGSTTPRSKVASKSIVLDTVEVSARPVVNVVELASGLAEMGQLIRDAAFEMETQYYSVMSSVLSTAMIAVNATPYYGTGSGISAAVIDPMIQHWQRFGGAAVLGDITAISQLAEIGTGFTVAAGTKQFSDSIITEQNNTGMIGTYKGARVINLVNQIPTGGSDLVFNKNHLYILPTAITADARPFKVLFQGDVSTIENTDIDTRSFEVRLDQWFGCGLVYGTNPNLSLYVIG